MPDVKISDLALAGSVDGTEILEVEQVGLPKRVTAAMIAALTPSGGGASVSDAPYDATGWDGDTANAPSKNALRDKFETLVGGGNVSAVPTPTSGQLSLWTSATQIQGVTTLPPTNFPALTGDVTTTTGSLTTTIANNAVGLTKMTTISPGRLLGRTSAGVGNVEVLSALPFAHTGDVTSVADSFALTYNNPVPTAKGGVPTGGTVAQVLAKIDGTNYNTQWVPAPGGGNVSNSGTPAAEQLSIWISATGLKGVAGIAVDSTNKNLYVNNAVNGVTTTVSAGTTAALTTASTYEQRLTGTLAHTHTLPVTSTLVPGHPFLFKNYSTGVWTIQSSGGNTVVTLPINTAATVECNTASGTGAASWDVISNAAVLTTTGTPVSGHMAVFSTSSTITGSPLGTGVLGALAAGTNLTSGMLTVGGNGSIAGCTGLAISTGVSGLGTGVATALAVNTSAAGAFGVLIASGTATINPGAIASGAVSSAITVAATGVATTDVIRWTPNADISAVTGYAPATTGGVMIYPYPTSGNVNFKVGNPTASSITPGSITLNWRVTR